MERKLIEKEETPETSVKKLPKLQALPERINTEKTSSKEESDTHTTFKKISPHEFSVSNLIKLLKNFPLSQKKLEFIEGNADLMPKTLSLSELNDILGLFPLTNSKLKVAKKFLPRLSTDYPESDFERFQKYFPLSSDKLKAINLLLDHKRQQSYTDN